ncbi:SDR family oxidoreductase [Oceanobacillus iheyensis]|uniref:Hypothetical conserved protein n=1 Tax=Oceanobacillus iheyensis (strain DSM 14371 / CIP 107618 / JCM 11309 / KCTC 3954 / HTE831) TaxID=221109 RepID=Q8ELT7_OCEIH|nr:SDR family oxidoreductase [Oceanobacillus iheyensis]BAC15086.1 hypothetical conserved protein [Oceanobacillus iheyensis HTE831]
MNVLVIGANGQIGTHLVNQLQSNESHQVTAMVRKEEQLEELKQRGINAVLANLEDGVDDIAKAMKGADAVVFTAGSGGSTGADKTLLIDLDGAVKSIEAAEKTGVKRFVMISAFQAHNRDSWADNPIKHYMVAKHFADEKLTESSLDYTIIRPGGLLNDPAIGKVQASENLERGSIPREDVASTVVEVLDAKNTYHKGFDLISGETSIKDAVGKI